MKNPHFIGFRESIIYSDIICLTVSVGSLPTFWFTACQRKIIIWSISSLVFLLSGFLNSLLCLSQSQLLSADCFSFYSGIVGCAVAFLFQCPTLAAQPYIQASNLHWSQSMHALFTHTFTLLLLASKLLGTWSDIHFKHLTYSSRLIHIKHKKQGVRVQLCLESRFKSSSICLLYISIPLC